ncbi:MAG: hypothetical protein WD042_03530 [Phycisphaeraceae bacterium]
MTRRTRLRFRWRLLAVSLVVTGLIAIVLAVPLSLLLMPHVQRWQTLGDLDSADPARHNKALNYVINLAARDPRVLRGAVAYLATPDDTRFFQLHTALDLAGVWRRKHIPDDAWLRHISLLLNDSDPEARIVGVQRLTELADLTGDDRLLKLLDHASRDSDDTARYNALFAIAELAGVAADNRAYVNLIGRMGGDDVPQIARHAWLFIGLLAPTHTGFVADWRERPPEVACAILWAALRTNPDHPLPAIEALRDASVDPQVQRMAAYALAMSDTDAARAALWQTLLDGLQAKKPDEILVQRLALALPPPAAEAISAKSAYLIHQRWPLSDASEPHPAVLAALHRAGPWLAAHEQLELIGGSDLRSAAPQRPEDGDASLAQVPAAHPLVRLALYEGLPIGAAVLPIDKTMPDLLRIAAVAVTRDPEPDDLAPALASPVSTWRDWACLVAARRFTPQQNEHLIARLLGGVPGDSLHFSDHAKMSGAVLAGLTNLRPAASNPHVPVDLLEDKARVEDMPLVREVMRMGLWMQGRPVADYGSEMAGRVRALLATGDADAPRSTFLLGLLYMGDKTALEYLFTPLAEPRIDLVNSLGAERMWPVLAAALPADAPPFWLWADADLQAFQVEVLRDWYLLHRHDPRVPTATKLGASDATK